MRALLADSCGVGNSAGGGCGRGGDGSGGSRGGGDLSVFILPQVVISQYAFWQTWPPRRKLLVGRDSVKKTPLWPGATMTSGKDICHRRLIEERG